MSTYLKLAATALLPVVVAILLYLLEKKVKRKAPYWLRQVVIGIIFGVITVMGTEFGIPLNGYALNSRDAAPLIAGLFFGAPAGIISGLIGGIERWFSVYWGVGAYTRVACSLSTIVAGFYAAFLRKFMFENKKPSWAISFACGVVIEIFHMSSVFFTHMSDTARALSVVQVCTVPMVTAVSLSVMLASLSLSLICHEPLFVKNVQIKISTTVQRYLLITVLIAFAMTTTFMYMLQTKMCEREIRSLLELSLNDIESDIEDAADKSAADIALAIVPMANSTNLDTLAQSFKAEELNLVDQRGVILASTNPDFVGFYMGEGEQSKEFMCLLQGETIYSQEYGPISYDANISRKYIGVTNSYGFLQVGLNADQFQSHIKSAVSSAAGNRHVGETGYLMILDQYYNVVSAPKTFEGIDISSLAAGNSVLANIREVFKTDLNSEECYCMFDTIEGYYVIAVYPAVEALETRNIAMFINTFLEVLVFAVLFAMIYFLIKNVVVNQIEEVNESLDAISGGNLNVNVNVRTNEEFASLSDDINETVETLKGYIAEAAARIDADLAMAKGIQASALPSVFPAFPNRREFDIYARMDTAKEVGGDFYDFYLTHTNILNFLIADVSGKGIPAALFMMRAKTELKSLTETGMNVSDVFTAGNHALCEGNDAGLFVTGWQGNIDLLTGVVKFANAGHNPPLIMHKGGDFEYLHSKVNLVLAGMDGVPYKEQELQMNPGDILFLYTDGVTEGTDANNELYGEDRLLKVLNRCKDKSVRDICDEVKLDLDAFVKDAPQFDDITMLCFKYVGGPEKMIYHKDEATIEDIPELTEMVEQKLEAMDCPMKALMQINVAIDEIYSNIANYAYGKGKGPATVIMQETQDKPGVSFTFEDEGMPYNPLVKEDPDTTLSAEERGVGGLGIYMVKKSMDSVHYEYANDKNIFTMTKYF